MAAAEPIALHPPVRPEAHPREAAKAIDLRYVTDHGPGIRRQKAGKGFSYLRPDGRKVTDEETLARIKRLAIPPAWTDVWIAPDEHGHLQATGRDARGRKQYRYHPKWRALRESTKYHRMLAFAKELPRLRERVEADLSRKGLPREKVLAAVVALLEGTLIRVGNDEYAKTNGSYGLTTLRDHHADFEGGKAVFRFRGKTGKELEATVDDPRLARIVKQCRDLPGQELFQYLDEDGNVVDVTSGDVNGYIREAMGGDFTAKDFRTWAGTVLCALALDELGPCERSTQAKKNVIAAIDRVAERLGNTRSVCRKSYVHPAIVQAYLDGQFAGALADVIDEDDDEPSLTQQERAVAAFLKRRLRAAAREAGGAKNGGGSPGAARTRRARKRSP